MDAASLIERAATPFPFFVRKLDKKSSWGHVDDKVQKRKEDVPPAIFASNNLRFSLYQIGNLDDLKRVTIALNAGRNRLKDQVDYVAFSAADLERSEIEIVGDAPGDTPCAAANSLHVDIAAISYACFEMLCHGAIDVGRPAFRVTKGEVKALIGACCFSCRGWF